MIQHPGIGNSLVAADHQTNYLEHGTGKPLFLLHGSGPGVSAWTNWSKVMPDLANQFRVLAFGSRWATTSVCTPLLPWVWCCSRAWVA